MNEQLQITEVNYFIDKREGVNSVLILPNKSFLEKSFNFIKLSELRNDANFVFLIGGWITQTSLLMQVKNPTDKFIKQDIINMLTGYWSILSFEEIIKAFELERFGVYSEKTEHFQLFDCNYIAQVFKKYQKWKRENKLELNINKDMEENVISEEEKSKLMSEAVNNKYSSFLLNNDIDDPFSHIFKELVERGVLKMPTLETPKLSKYYDDKLILAKSEILNELQNTTSDDKSKRLNLKSMIESILSETFNQDAKSKVELRAKKLVLIDYFNKCKLDNKTKII